MISIAGFRARLRRAGLVSVAVAVSVPVLMSGFSGLVMGLLRLGTWSERGFVAEGQVAHFLRQMKPGEWAFEGNLDDAG